MANFVCPTFFLLENRVLSIARKTVVIDHLARAIRERKKAREYRKTRG